MKTTLRELIEKRGILAFESRMVLERRAKLRNTDVRKLNRIGKLVEEIDGRIHDKFKRLMKHK